MKLQSSFIDEFIEFVLELSGEEDSVLRAFRQAVPLDDNFHSLPALTINNVFEAAARRYECPDFGIRLAAHTKVAPPTPSCSNPFLLAAYNAENVHEALTCTVRGMRSLSRDSESHFHYRRPVKGQWAALECKHTEGAGRPPVQIVEHRIAAVFHSLADICGTRDIFEIWFAHPPCAPKASYETYLPVKIRFDRPHDAIRIRTDALDRPINSRNKAIFKIARYYIEQRYPESNCNLLSEIEDVIAKLLEQRRCTLQAVAAELELQPRSLQRRLNDARTSFFVLKDDVRRKQALDALAHSDTALKDIARRLGYSTAAGFTRSCLRWFSAPPQKVRSSLVRDRRVGLAATPAGPG